MISHRSFFACLILACFQTSGTTFAGIKNHRVTKHAHSLFKSSRFHTVLGRALVSIIRCEIKSGHFSDYFEDRPDTRAIIHKVSTLYSLASLMANRERHGKISSGVDYIAGSITGNLYRWLRHKPDAVILFAPIESGEEVTQVPQSKDPKLEILKSELKYDAIMFVTLFASRMFGNVHRHHRN